MGTPVKYKELFTIFDNNWLTIIRPVKVDSWTKKGNFFLHITAKLKK